MTKTKLPTFSVVRAASPLRVTASLLYDYRPGLSRLIDAVQNVPHTVINSAHADWLRMRDSGHSWPDARIAQAIAVLRPEPDVLRLALSIEHVPMGWCREFQSFQIFRATQGGTPLLAPMWSDPTFGSVVCDGSWSLKCNSLVTVAFSRTEGENASGIRLLLSSQGLTGPNVAGTAGDSWSRAISDGEFAQIDPVTRWLAGRDFSGPFPKRVAPCIAKPLVTRDTVRAGFRYAHEVLSQDYVHFVDGNGQYHDKVPFVVTFGDRSDGLTPASLRAQLRVEAGLRFGNDIEPRKAHPLNTLSWRRRRKHG